MLKLTTLGNETIAVRRPARVDDRWERSCSSSRLGGHAASASLGKAGRVARREPRASPRASGTPQDDPSTFVRRSVANNLNDLGKVHPQQPRSYLCGLARSESATRRALVEHALRTR